MSYRFYILATIAVWLQPFYLQGQIRQHSNPDYLEILLGNKDVPLFVLGQEILSSQDVQACSLEDVNQLNTFQPNVLHQNQTKKQPTTPSRQRFENLLLGFH